MDLATLIGLLIGLGGLMVGFLLEGGQAGMLFTVTAAIIVFGGTFGAVIISFTADELRHLPTAFKKVFRRDEIAYMSSIDQIVDLAEKARREGLLSLEDRLGDIDDDFLHRGLQLVIDGMDPEATKHMLEVEIETFETEEMIGSNIFMLAGGYAPTMGIIGTVLGLIYALSSMVEPDKIASAIAMAFLATFYGIVSANLLWIPFGTKLEVKAEKRVHLKNLIMAGILAIQLGEHPQVIREKLNNFLPLNIRQELVKSNQADDFWM